MKCLKCQKPFATAPDQLCADCTPNRNLQEIIRIAKEQADRNQHDEGCKGSVRNEEFWKGYRKGVEAIEAALQATFNSQNKEDQERKSPASDGSH